MLRVAASAVFALILACGDAAPTAEFKGALAAYEAAMAVTIDHTDPVFDAVLMKLRAVPTSNEREHRKANMMIESIEADRAKIQQIEQRTRQAIDAARPTVPVRRGTDHMFAPRRPTDRRPIDEADASPKKTVGGAPAEAAAPSPSGARRSFADAAEAARKSRQDVETERRAREDEAARRKRHQEAINKRFAEEQKKAGVECNMITGKCAYKKVNLKASDVPVPDAKPGRR